MNKAHKPPMLVIAEMAMSKKEIHSLLYEKAEIFIQSKCLMGPRVSQQEVVEHLFKVADNYWWSEFQRKKTIEKVAARACARNGVYLKRRLPPVRRRPLRADRPGGGSPSSRE